jgi:hypothetical protein
VRILKYEPLRVWLMSAPHPAETAFDQLARLVGGLPPSAYRHRAWWANDASHVQARAWLDAGWRVSEVNLDAQRVEFS